MNDLFRETELMMTRRQLFGRTALGLGTAAMAGLMGRDLLGADLKNGLLSIDLARPEPEKIVRRIDIAARD